ncbi:hypothetical protein AGLY_001417 [Aphis glycines]|uniref:Uncharacterized protein n=1 Tax=Aphis glycines TaxID=307491 RepID=A0A6G0U546_APHGL|nr:hypothetical protein AGLY_001417 [Aphis glycines]
MTHEYHESPVTNDGVVVVVVFGTIHKQLKYLLPFILSNYVKTRNYVSRLSSVCVLCGMCYELCMNVSTVHSIYRSGKFESKDSLGYHFEWLVIGEKGEVKSKRFPTVFKKTEKNKKKVTDNWKLLCKTVFQPNPFFYMVVTQKLITETHEIFTTIKNSTLSFPQVFLQVAIEKTRSIIIGKVLRTVTITIYFQTILSICYNSKIKLVKFSSIYDLYFLNNNKYLKSFEDKSLSLRDFLLEEKLVENLVLNFLSLDINTNNFMIFQLQNYLQISAFSTDFFLNYNHIKKSIRLKTGFA